MALVSSPIDSVHLFRLQSWRNRKREEEDDAAFPDEIDTPIDVAARTRFQRFRGLRSFRTSPWDPYENLPRDYARIFQFEDFKRTERAVKRRAEEDAGVEVCAHCILWRCDRSYILMNAGGHPRHDLHQRRAKGGRADSFRAAFRGVQPPAARAQKDCSQLHCPAQYRIRRDCALEGKLLRRQFPPTLLIVAL